ncbi:MAG: ATP-binding protein [Pseudobutyrivibrio sp.]|nr:ATP-binding protein [Pseudobutyrivibrio sp.]
MKKIECEAVVSNLDKVMAFVEQELEALECGMKQQMQITVAVEEIYVNIAHYAYGITDDNGNIIPDSGSGPMSLSLGEDDGVVTLVFEDRGIPFNPLEKDEPDVTLSADDREIGGLGILLVKKNLDNVSYKYCDGKNVLTLEKRVL